MAIDKLESLLDRLDRRLGPSTKYRLGKRYKRQGRFADALEAFRQSEAWFVEERGPDHPYVVSAVVMQAYCYARMRRIDEACFHYDRALTKMNQIGDSDHELARQIQEYVAAVCG